jgi:excisionase family DNA binding protein
MKPIQFQLSISLDGESLSQFVGLFAEAIEKGIARGTRAESRRDKSTVEPEKAKMTSKATQHAHFGGQEPPKDAGLLIDTREAAKLLNVSARKLWQMYNSGEMPAPIRIGRAVRWSYEPLKEWVATGCPKQR